jgi:hypothetical protein
MSWYSGRTVRFPVAVDKLTAGTTAIDLTFDIPADLIEFWAEVASDKSDIRVTDADGLTNLTWQASAWSHSATGGTATIQVDAWTPPAEDCIALIWIYAGGGDTTNEGSFTASAPRTGTVWSCGIDGPVAQASTGLVGATRPTQVVGKSTDETLMIWLDVGARLAPRPVAFNGTKDCEEIESITYTVELAGADQSALYDETAVRFDRRGLVRLQVQAGTVDTEYTVSPVITTTNGRTLNPRLILSVIDPDET